MKTLNRLLDFATRPWGGTLILVFALVIGVGGNLVVNYFKVTPGQPFTIEGKFLEGDLGGYTSLTGMMDYDFSYYFLIENERGEATTYSAGGAWNGSLPLRGTPVRINSPSGLIRDVTITELATGKEYRPGKNWVRPEAKEYQYRVSGRNTGVVLCEGSVYGFDSFQALRNGSCEGKTLYSLTFEGQPYVVQVWGKGIPAPPPYSP